MIKTAYELGVQRALADLGLVKQAGMDDPTIGARSGGEGNPAETLAELFQQAEIPAQKVSPDNKTRDKDTKDEQSGVRWGPTVNGNGSDALSRNAPGHYMPSNGAV